MLAAADDLAPGVGASGPRVRRWTSHRRRRGGPGTVQRRAEPRAGAARRASRGSGSPTPSRGFPGMNCDAWSPSTAPWSALSNPIAVVHLQRHFRVSYAPRIERFRTRLSLQHRVGDSRAHPSRARWPRRSRPCRREAIPTRFRIALYRSRGPRATRSVAPRTRTPQPRTRSHRRRIWRRPLRRSADNRPHVRCNAVYAPYIAFL